MSAAPSYVADVIEEQVYLAGPGLAQQDAAGANTRYQHGDLVDSAMLLTGGNGAAVSTMSYTAFGEPVVWTGSTWQLGGELPAARGRYGYAGGWGYESGHYQDPPAGSTLPGFSDLLALYGPNAALAPVTLQHVGWRWYQAEIGRFVQRDPIGIGGGRNVYVYCSSNPTTVVDPSGMVDHGMDGCPQCGWMLPFHAPGCSNSPTPKPTRPRPPQPEPQPEPWPKNIVRETIQDYSPLPAAFDLPTAIFNAAANWMRLICVSHQYWQQS